MWRVGPHRTHRPGRRASSLLVLLSVLLLTVGWASATSARRSRRHEDLKVRKFDARACLAHSKRGRAPQAPLAMFRIAGTSHRAAVSGGPILRASCPARAIRHPPRRSRCAVRFWHPNMRKHRLMPSTVVPNDSRFHHVADRRLRVRVRGAERRFRKGSRVDYLQACRCSADRPKARSHLAPFALRPVPNLVTGTFVVRAGTLRALAKRATRFVGCASCGTACTIAASSLHRGRMPALRGGAAVPLSPFAACNQ